MQRFPTLLFFFASTAFSILESAELTSSWVNSKQSGTNQGQGFTRIPADLSGLSHANEYTHPERWRSLWHQYFLGTIGSGIALGDIDGDGLADVFSVGKDSSNRLYLNLGDLVFQECSGDRGVAEKTGIGAGVSMVDIENDGDLDIYVVYTGSENELYLNDGSGYLREAAEEWGLALSTGSNAPSFADYDRDGDLDLYLQCNFLSSSGLAEGMPDILLENVGGRYVDRSEEAGISGRAQGHAAIWWDFDEDGWPDLYVANDFEPADRLYRNNGDGTFTDVIHSHFVTSPYSAMGADFGDLNNDSRMDMFVGEMAPRDSEKYQRTLATIATKSIYAPRYSASQYMQNMLSVKIGQSQFAEISRMAGLFATDWTWAPRVLDFDNDGLQDMLFTNGMIRAFHDGDIGLKSEKARTGWQRMAYFKSSPRYDERNLLYRNAGGLDFDEVGESLGFSKVGVSFSAAFADLDLDGDLDIVVSEMDEELSLYRNEAATGSSVSIRLQGVESNRFGVGAKLWLYCGEDVYYRELSLTRGYLSTDEPVLHFGIGEHLEVNRLEIEWPSGFQQTVRGLEPNNRYLIEEVNNGIVRERETLSVFSKAEIDIPKDSMSKEESYDLHPKQMLLPEDESRLGPPIEVSDLDEDGYLDVILGGPSGWETRVLWNESGRRFSVDESDLLSDVFDSEDTDFLVQDLGDDGVLDFIASSGGVELDEGDAFYRDRVYSFSKQREVLEAKVEGLDFESRSTSSSLLIDVDADGDMDLVQAGGTRRFSYPDYEDNLVWKFEEGSFAEDFKSEFSKAFSRSGKTSDLLAVDWSGDGKLDLVQAVQWGAPIFWKQTNKGLVRFDGVLDRNALSGAWSSLASGDFDGDGRLDIVIGNRGLNLRHVPSVDAPLVLFSPKGARNRNVYIDCFTENGRLLPVESRILNAIQFPGLLERTTSSIADYASKDVHEIFTPEVLDQFRRSEICETRSMILYQREEGRFSAAALPRWAQSGTVMDVLVFDYDSDGWEDLVLSLEPRAPKLWVDRPLKGHVVLLRNEVGQGFRTVLPYESGLEVDGYPRHMAWADLDKDGRGELLLTMSDGPLLVFSLNSAEE
ncbi:FG-GAP repeat domain protein [Verrucomicrobiia bacterium DG1235]|nr:FG-GAP repeat domain protein [Verrucomicrobiae bacterium DG1235]